MFATSLLSLLCYGALLARSSPLPPPVITESGNGIAPWAGQGPKPEPRVSASRVGPEPQAAAAAAAAGDSAVPVGTIITSCTEPGVVALTFDDGPYIYTGQILDTLKASDVPATFFVNGDNWANILSESSRALVQRYLDEGHQIGSHTYVVLSYPSLQNTIWYSQGTIGYGY